MRADEPDEYHAPVVVHRRDQTVIVALDVEHGAVVRDHAGVPVRSLDFHWVPPIRAACQRVPGTQRDFGVWVLFPEIPQRGQCDDPHANTLSCSQNGSNITGRSPLEVRMDSVFQPFPLSHEAAKWGIIDVRNRTEGLTRPR